MRPDVSIEYSDSPDGTSIVRDGERGTLYTPQGQPRCSFDYPGRFSVPLRSLTETIVMLDYSADGPSTLLSRESLTCRKRATDQVDLKPGPGSFSYLRGAAGVTLLLHSVDDTEKMPQTITTITGLAR